MNALEQRRVVIRAADRPWVDARIARHRRALLYEGPRETVFLERLEPGCTMAAQHARGGREMLVVEGSVEVSDGSTRRTLVQGESIFAYPGDSLTVTGADGAGTVVVAAPGV
jgi:quercetin dioxygenase-like cupin family protein